MDEPHPLRLLKHCPFCLAVQEMDPDAKETTCRLCGSTFETSRATSRMLQRR